MTQHDHPKRRLLSRRQFLGAAAAGVVGLGAAGATYGFEARNAPAPFSPEAGLVPPATASGKMPEAPLLLIGNGRETPSFDAFLGEILRAEGLIAFRETTLAALDPQSLSAFPLAVLAPGPLQPDEAELVRRYVAQGGALLALRPDQRLADVFGVRHLGALEDGGYLQVVPGAPAVAGIEPGPLQYHGPSDRLELAGARELARSAAGAPLVTLHRFDAGLAALWAFDLAQSIALLRQGNPAYADVDRDDIEGVRAADMFADWIDLDRIHIPQADEHQRLFADVLNELSSAGPPLPRLWYFPAGAPSVLVTTGDAHGSTANYVADVLERVERYNGTMSIYYTPPPASTLGRMARKARWWAADIPVAGVLLQRDQPLPTPGHLAAWRERGHEFGMHPYVEQGLEQGYNAYWNEFIKFGYGPVPPTVRTHRILWHGWVDNARVQAQYGLRMNLDHYHVGNVVQAANGEWRSGYLSGTGLPMRFIGEDGALLTVFQQPTHLVDEHLMNVFDTGHDQGLDGATAASITTAQIAACVRRYPAALGMQCHIDPFLLGGDKAANVGRWLDETLAFSAAAGVPILAAERWLAFVEARSNAQVAEMNWDAATGRWHFTIDLPPHSIGPLELLLPLRHNAATLGAIEVNGATQPRRTQSLAGREYAAVSLTPGANRITAGYGRS